MYLNAEMAHVSSTIGQTFSGYKETTANMEKYSYNLQTIWGRWNSAGKMWQAAVVHGPSGRMNHGHYQYDVINCSSWHTDTHRDTSVMRLRTAEGTDGLCSDWLRQNSGLCRSATSSPATTTHWWRPCTRSVSYQRTRWTSRCCADYLYSFKKWLFLVPLPQQAVEVAKSSTSMLEHRSPSF